jgi:formimidoylglutamase
VQISKEAEKLLLAVPRPGNWVPDEYDVGVKDIMVDWKETRSADAGIVGIPFDTAVMGRRGCRFGPEGVRSALVFSNVYEPGLDMDLSKGFVLTDFGNIDVIHTDVLKTHERVEKVVTEIFKTGVTPAIIGGDHSLAYPDIKSLINVVDGDVGVINIDGHMDVRISHHGEISSGTPFRRLLEQKEKPLKPKHFVEIGINGWLNSGFYRQYCRDQGIRIIPAREVHQRGIVEVVQEALGIVANGTKAIFLTVDIDGLDISVAPGTNAPNPGGLTAYQALEAVWLIGQHPLCRAMDLLEVAPPLDMGNLTSLMGAALVLHFLGATKKRKESSKKR